jgi:hypothetical protein
VRDSLRVTELALLRLESLERRASFGDVLDERQRHVRLSRREHGRDSNPDDAPVLSHVPLLELGVPRLARPEKGGGLQVSGLVLGMGDVEDGQPAELVLRVADELAEALVRRQELTVGPDERNPDVRVVEDRLPPFFGEMTGPFRNGVGCECPHGAGDTQRAALAPHHDSAFTPAWPWRNGRGTMFKHAPSALRCQFDSLNPGSIPPVECRKRQRIGTTGRPSGRFDPTFAGPAIANDPAPHARAALSLSPHVVTGTGRRAVGHKDPLEVELATLEVGDRAGDAQRPVYRGPGLLRLRAPALE